MEKLECPEGVAETEITLLVAVTSALFFNCFVLGTRNSEVFAEILAVLLSYLAFLILMTGLDTDYDRLKVTVSGTLVTFVACI